MNIQERLEQARDLLKTWNIAEDTPEENRLDITIDPMNLPHAVQTLIDTEWGYLSTITGLDHGPAEGRMEALYHFCSGAAVLTLRIRLGREHPTVPTVCGIIPSASFFERELIEMFGVTITDTPNTDHLFLPDDWPAGVYPLRKDFDQAQLKRPHPSQAES